jgi:4-hydroxyacetophenone monooxygenase
LPHIEVLTDRIARFTEGGLETESGVSHDFDVVIYATGFHASKIVWPMAIYGRTGENLQDLWDGDPRAYLGITVPDFPNFFMTYGPNTNIVVNGSIVFFSECEIRYILGCLALSMEQGQSLAVKHAVHDRFNEAVDRANEEMAWGAPHVKSWYKNAKGRVTQNWPFTLLEYWNRTRAPAVEDFEFFAPEGPAQKRA